MSLHIPEILNKIILHLIHDIRNPPPFRAYLESRKCKLVTQERQGYL